MHDIEEIPLETSEGARPASTPGDRLVVGLATLALLGGLLIAGANLFDGLRDDGVATASGEPRASAEARPSRSPRPSPTPRPPREVTVVPGTPEPYPIDGFSTPMGWLEVRRPTVLRAAATTTAQELDQLSEGSVLLVSLGGPEGWALTIEPRRDGRTGWVQLHGADGEADALVHLVDAQPYSGWIGSTWNGPSGLLAVAVPPHTQYQPDQPLLLSSTDGEHWLRVRADPTLVSPSMQAAWGPSGWLAVSNSSDSDDIWIWNSYDGRSWDVLGRMRPGSDSGWANQVVASRLGYMAVLDEYRPNGSASVAWFSDDGVVWQESIDPFGRTDRRLTDGSTLRLLATDSGFLAWIMKYGPSPAEADLAYSTDGLSWTQLTVDSPPLQSGLQLATVGDTLLGLGQTPGGNVLAWRANLADGAATHLVRDPRLEAALGDAVAPAIASDGAHAYVLAFDLPGGEPRILASDGGSWRRITVPRPSPFGPRPYIASAGPVGLVLIGSRPNVAGDNPVFWHLRQDGSWVVEPDPILPVVPDPTPEDCGPLPTTGLQFAVLPASWGPLCFGDRPMTFTTWSAPCEWCAPGIPEGDVSWLMDSGRQLFLRPAAGDPWPNSEAVLHPDLELATDTSGEWIRVTGHFDDPAAADCAWEPEPLWVYYDPADTAVVYCRQRFVVTELTLAEPPG